MCWDALYFIVSTSALVVQKLNNRPYSSVNACPPARMQRLAREIIQSKEFWIICCFKLRHDVTIASRSSLKLCFRTGVIWIAHRLVPINWRYSLVSWDFFQQCLEPEQLTSSNQPTNWNNNRKKIVKVLQLVLIGPFQLILGGSKNVCLSLNTVFSVNIAWKVTRHISKFKLNIVEYTVIYLSVITLLLFKL
jgi:hypothetical protein